MNLSVILIGVLLLLLSACAHHRDVRPGADGTHRVALQTDDTDAATRDAIDQANHFCKSRNKGSIAAFVDEKQKYTGDMDEQTYKNSKRIAKAASAAGGAVWALGGKRESNAGGIVGLGGGVADGVLGKGYTVEMKFKCQ